MKKSKLVFISWLLLVAAMTACEKEGPIGPAGEQGIAGPAGPQGAKGATGTANVIYSDLIPLNWNNINTDKTKAMKIDESRITETFLKTGLILFFLYATPYDKETIYSVPFSRNNTTFYFYATDSQIVFIASGLLGTNANANFFSHVRYVLIPGSINAGNALKNIDLKDFNAVAKTLNIQF